MAGIDAAEEMTKDQLEAMAGGELLKGEAGYFSQVRYTKRSSRLKEALGEHDLAVALCLLMAQQRYCVVYQETEKSHIKLVGKLYDQCQDALVQYGTFLGSTMSMEEYVTRLPSIHSLLAEYHIHTDVAFFLARPMFTHAINMKYDALRKADPNCKKLSAAAKQAKYCEAVAEVMGPIATSVKPLHPPKVWEDISPQFLVTFWSLTMYDLFVPVESYTKEINRIKQLATNAESKEILVSKQKKEQDRCLALAEKLLDERKKQQEHVEKVMARLAQEKDSWFLSRSAKSAKNETITQFLQLCLFPRCVFTMTDAVYCAKFVHTLHSLKTANFSTLLCYDRLFCDITYSVTSCTENEANRYGTFLCAMLETVMRWHSEKEIFDQECASYPGFVTKFRVSNQFSEANDHVGYENYRHVCHKWHYKITKAMLVCLESKDYVQIRNALIILIKILPHFPVLLKLSQFIEKKIEKVKEDEKNQRQDLYTLAISYSGQLKAKLPQMIKENDFHLACERPIKKEEGVVAVNKSSDKVDSGQNIGAGSLPVKQVNGELKPTALVPQSDNKSALSADKPRQEKDVVIVKERRALTRSSVDTSGNSASVKSVSEITTTGLREKTEKKDKEQLEREKQLRKEEKREEMEKQGRKEKKDEKLSREERVYREERERDRDRERERDRDRDREREMIPLSKDETTLRSSGGGSSSYYGGSSSFYPVPGEERELSSVSNSSSGSLHGARRSNEPPENDRDTKRRKLDGSSSSKSTKHEDRKLQVSLEGSNVSVEKLEKKEKREKGKSKVVRSDEEKELRKERKLGRKRDRAEEAAILATEQKKRKEEEKIAKMALNGDQDSHSSRDKYHYSRDKSPYGREPERSHERETRDKHRRSGGDKRR